MPQGPPGSLHLESFPLVSSPHTARSGSCPGKGTKEGQIPFLDGTGHQQPKEMRCGAPSLLATDRASANRDAFQEADSLGFLAAPQALLSLPVFPPSPERGRSGLLLLLQGFPAQPPAFSSPTKEEHRVAGAGLMASLLSL